MCVCIDTYISIYLNHFSVHLKLTQYYKSTLLQLKQKDTELFPHYKDLPSATLSHSQAPTISHL